MNNRIGTRLACLFAAAGFAALASTAAAQQTVAAYYAALGPQDWYNSQGTQLRDFGAILQQDRANYHRFGRADPYDDGDPFFGDGETRAMIPALFAAGDDGWWSDWVRRVSPPTSLPVEAHILVFVCASGGRLTHLIVSHANGDGHLTCEGPVTAGQ